MIDLHSHILPDIDDGSKNVEESLALLDSLSEQRIKTVVATPHYEAEHETPDEFIERRRKSFEMLKADAKDGLPTIILGAEVAYYPGIKKLDGLHKLCIEGSDILLLEMPISEWSEYIIKELTALALRGRMKIVLAHVERYLFLQSKENISRLYDCGILMQCNASVFLQFRTKRKALKMLKNGEIDFIGSDCHNMTTRPPRIGEAYGVIKNKFGDSFYTNFCNYGITLINRHELVEPKS